MFSKRLILVSLFFSIISLVTTEKVQTMVSEDKKPFDTKAAHKLFMPYIWTILIDVIVLLAFYQYRRYTKLIHAILGVGIIVTTLVTSIPFLIKNGFHTKHLTHYIIGVVIYGLMSLQFLLGVSKFGLIYFNKGNSLIIYVIKIIHKFVGYALVIIVKVQIFIFLQPQRSEYSFFLGWEIAVGIIFFYRLYAFPKMAKTIMPQQNVRKRITSFSQVENGLKKFTIFGNYVYDLSPLKMHPAGYKIIEAVRNESVDKYVYGMYSSQVETKLPKYSHSEASFHLLGKPQAKIDISSLYQGFNDQIVKVKVVSIKNIGPHLFELRLAKNEGFSFRYKGYEHLSQLGRFYSLTLDRKITRLYTSVNFLAKSNKDLLKSIYFNSKNIDIEYTFESSKSKQNLLNESFAGNYSDDSQIPLLIKQYEDGQFTRKLPSLQNKVLQLSEERGFGLSFSSLTPGKVIIVVGGTGLFPFCDLIDLLFKDSIIKNSSSQVKVQILKENPILSKNPFDKFYFRFYGSFNQIQDVPKITLHQIHYLCKHSDFKFIFRFDKRPSQELIETLQIQLKSQRFQIILPNEIVYNSLSKLFVCGPPRMNSVLRKLLQQSLPREKYQVL